MILPVQEHLELGILDLPLPLPLLLRLVVNDDVRLVDNLLLDDLLDDVLQCHKAHRLVEGIALALVVHLLDEGHVALVARFELVEHVREDGVLVDKIHVVLVEAADLLQRFVVVRVDEEEVAGKQDVDHVGALSLGKQSFVCGSGFKLGFVFGTIVWIRIRFPNTDLLPTVTYIGIYMIN